MMDERNCQSLTDTQPVEKNKALDEAVVKPLHTVQALLDQPLHHFTENTIIEITAHLSAILKVIQSQPQDTRQTHTQHNIRQCLRHTIIELTLALDQLSNPEKKASFYEHILLAQEYFSEVIAHNFVETIENKHTEVAAESDAIISFPHNDVPLPKNNIPLQAFSKKILPDMQLLIEKTDSINMQRHAQILKNIQILEELLEKQKELCQFPHSIDEYATTIVCWRLTVSLSYASELLQQLKQLLIALQAKPYPRSKQTIQLRDKMLYSFTLFSHNFDNILQQTQEFTRLQQQEHFQSGGEEREKHKIISIRR